ncbi:hypothetical protein VCX44_23470, partial [Aeromonas caviae]
RQAIGPLPTGVVEGRGQGVHREDRLSHPGRTDAVNPVLVNRYRSLATRLATTFCVMKKNALFNVKYCS